MEIQKTMRMERHTQAFRTQTDTRFKIDGIRMTRYAKRITEENGSNGVNILFRAEKIRRKGTGVISFSKTPSRIKRFYLAPPAVLAHWRQQSELGSPWPDTRGGPMSFSTISTLRTGVAQFAVGKADDGHEGRAAAALTVIQPRGWGITCGSQVSCRPRGQHSTFGRW